MKKYCGLILLLLINLNLLFADNSYQTVFDSANKLYQSGNFEAAAKKYEEILKYGKESSQVYYNLGNTYFKLNNIPESILYYEKALKLSPNNEDIDFNLKMANLKVVDKMSAVPEIFYKKWLNDFSAMFTADQWTIISIVITWLVLSLVVVFIMSHSANVKRAVFSLGLILILVAGLSFYGAVEQKSIQSSSDYAVIFEPSVYVKSSPNDKSVDLFILHEGTKIKILDAIGEWKRIRLINGNEGWLNEKVMRII